MSENVTYLTWLNPISPRGPRTRLRQATLSAIAFAVSHHDWKTIAFLPLRGSALSPPESSSSAVLRRSHQGHLQVHVYTGTLVFNLVFHCSVGCPRDLSELGEGYPCLSNSSLYVTSVSIGLIPFAPGYSKDYFLYLSPLHTFLICFSKNINEFQKQDTIIRPNQCQINLRNMSWTWHEYQKKKLHFRNTNQFQKTQIVFLKRLWKWKSKNW